jgi:hypothetical protein
MPIHDWTRVTAGTFHDFHLAWIAEIRRVLNAGLLPDGYYAQAEQVANGVIPDVLTLQDASGGPDNGHSNGRNAENGDGGVAVADAPPRVAVQQSITELTALAGRQRRLVIRHTTGDRIVALIEIVSPGNKQRRPALDSFVDKALAALTSGYQLLILDLFPPGPFDPTGIHGAIWGALGDDYVPPPGKPLTLAAYATRGDIAGPRAPGAVNAYVEPTAPGTALIDMPLFLSATRYVSVPLEPTYAAAYDGVPKRWKRVIEGDK